MGTTRSFLHPQTIKGAYLGVRVRRGAGDPVDVRFLSRDTFPSVIRLDERAFFPRPPVSEQTLVDIDSKGFVMGFGRAGRGGPLDAVAELKVEDALEANFYAAAVDPDAPSGGQVPLIAARLVASMVMGMQGVHVLTNRGDSLRNLTKFAFEVSEVLPHYDSDPEAERAWRFKLKPTFDEHFRARVWDPHARQPVVSVESFEYLVSQSNVPMVSVDIPPGATPDTHPQLFALLGTVLTTQSEDAEGRICGWRGIYNERLNGGDGFRVIFASEKDHSFSFVDPLEYAQVSCQLIGHQLTDGRSEPGLSLT